MPASCRIGPFLKSHPCFFTLPAPLSSVGGAWTNPCDVTGFQRGWAADYRLNRERRFDKSMLGRERGRNIAGILVEPNVIPFKSQAKFFLAVDIFRKTARLYSCICSFRAVKCWSLVSINVWRGCCHVYRVFILPRHHLVFPWVLNCCLFVQLDRPRQIATLVPCSWNQ